MNKTLPDPKQEALLKDPTTRLVEELKDAHPDLPDEQISRLVKDSLERFAKARIREFVPVLASRHAKRHIASGARSQHVRTSGGDLGGGLGKPDCALHRALSRDSTIRT